MEIKIDSLIERFEYTKACFCMPDMLALETVKLSSKYIQTEFSSELNQKR